MLNIVLIYLAQTKPIIKIVGAKENSFLIRLKLEKIQIEKMLEYINYRINK